MLLVLVLFLLVVILIGILWGKRQDQNHLLNSFAIALNETSFHRPQKGYNNPVDRSAVLEKTFTELINAVRMWVEKKGMPGWCIAGGAGIAFVMLFLFSARITVPFLGIVAVVGKIIFEKREKAQHKQKGEIEREIPRMVEYLRRKFLFSRDVVGALTDYMGFSASPLKEEIGFLVANLCSGQGDAAFERAICRVGLDEFTDVCRGLCAVYRGESADSYWSHLSFRMRELEKGRIREEMQQVPKRIERLSLVAVISFGFIFLSVIVVDTYQSICMVL